MFTEGTTGEDGEDSQGLGKGFGLIQTTWNPLVEREAPLHLCELERTSEYHCLYSGVPGKGLARQQVHLGKRKSG